MLFINIFSLFNAKYIGTFPLKKKKETVTQELCLEKGERLSNRCDDVYKNICKSLSIRKLLRRFRGFL